MPEVDRGPSAPRAIGRNLSWLVVGEGVIKLALLGVAALVARGLGPAGLGTFTLVYGGTLFLVVILALGQVEVLIREVAARTGAARGLLARSLALERRALLPLLPLLALGLVLLLVHDPSLAWAAVSFLPYAFLRSRLITVGAAFKGLDRMDMEIRARGLETLLALAGVALVTTAGWPVWALGIAFTLGAGVGLGWISTRRGELGGTALGGSAPSGSTAVPSPGELMREGWPFLLLALLAQLLYRGDVFLLEMLGVGRQEVGFYGAAGTLVWGAVTLAQLTALALYPTLARMARRGMRPARAALASCATGLAVGGGLAAVLSLLAAPLVGLLFGAGYDSAVELLRILAWALPGASAAMLVGTVLAAWHRQRLALALQAVLVAGVLVADLAAIPHLGAAGAAWVAVAGQALLAASQLVGALVLPASGLGEEEG